jgi:hypothetical protein
MRDHGGARHDRSDSSTIFSADKTVVVLLECRASVLSSVTNNSPVTVKAADLMGSTFKAEA